MKCARTHLNDSQNQKLTPLQFTEARVLHASQRNLIHKLFIRPTRALTAPPSAFWRHPFTAEDPLVSM